MSTTKNAVYVLSSQLVLLLSGTIIGLGLGRLLGPELYGKYGVVMAIATVMNILITPGIMQAVAKFVAEDKGRAAAIAKVMLKKQILLGIVLAAAYFFLATPLTYALKDKSLLTLLQILTPLMVFYSLAAVYSGYLTGLGRFLQQSVQLILYSTSRLVLTFLLAYFFSLTGAVVAMPAASLIALVYFAYTARLGSKETPAPEAYKVYKFSAQLTLFSALTAIFMNVDLLLVQALLNNPEATGYYTAASTVARIPYFVLIALGTLILPIVAGKLTSSAEEAQRFVKEAFRYVLMLLLPATALLATTAKPLIMLLYRSEYVQAAEPTAILAVGAAALTLAYILASVLNASGKTIVTVAVTAAMLAASVIANLTVIPQYGLKGSALVVTVTAAVAMIILGLAAYKRLGTFISYKSLIRTVAATAVVFAIAESVQLQNKFLLPLEYVILSVLYVSLLFILREINSSDIKRLRSLIQRA